MSLYSLYRILRGMTPAPGGMRDEQMGNAPPQPRPYYLLTRPLGRGASAYAVNFGVLHYNVVGAGVPFKWPLHVFAEKIAPPTQRGGGVAPWGPQQAFLSSGPRGHGLTDPAVLAKLLGPQYGPGATK